MEFFQEDASKAKADLGWEPKTTLDELVKDMVSCDIRLMKRKPEAFNQPVYGAIKIYVKFHATIIQYRIVHCIKAIF